MRSLTGIAAIVGIQAVLGLAAGPAVGATLTVDNHSFESPDIDTGFTRIGGTENNFDWTVETTGNADLFILHETAGSTPTAPDGNQWLDAARDDDEDNGRVHQNVGTVQDGLRYTLELTVGSRGNNSLPGDFFMGLWADSEASPSSPTVAPDNPLAQKTKSDITLADTAKDTTAVSVSYDATGSSFAGQNLFVRLGVQSDVTSGAQVLFDDVSVTAIPEPATLALLAPAGLLMLRRRR